MNLFEKKVELSRQVSKEENASKILRLVKKDSYFGELSFFTGSQRNASAKATTFTTILKISRKMFLEIVKLNDKEFQQMCLIKDNILQYSDFTFLQIKCRICNNFKHFESDCPIMHFDREETNNRIRTFEKFKQNRTQVSRKQIKTKNSLQIAIKTRQNYSQNFQNHLFPISNINISKQNIFDDDLDRNNDKVSTKKRLYTQTQIDSHFNPIESIMINGQASFQQNYFEEERQRTNTDYFLQAKQLGEISQKYLKSDLLINVGSNLSPNFKPNSQSQISQIEEKDSLAEEAEEEDKDDDEKDLEEDEDDDDQQSENQNFKPRQINQMMSMLQYYANANNMKSIRSKNKRFDQQQTGISRDNEKRLIIERNNREEKILWLMDELKDYQYYFPDGNSGHTIVNYNRYQRNKRRRDQKYLTLKRKNMVDSPTVDTSKQKLKHQKKQKSCKKQIQFTVD